MNMLVNFKIPTRQLIITTIILILCFNLGAQNGPKSPEASSFEPIDATDMVNLSTGSLTYVLPLLSVPSPEGGYPLSLSYHGGIPVDKESSWVGLGWNVNPGAINRSINGFPDDYKIAEFSDMFFDTKVEEKNGFAMNIGYSAGAVSAGLGISSGDLYGVGGFVSFSKAGVEITLGHGTYNSSIGLGAKIGSLNVGASINSQGSVGVKAKMGALGLGTNIGNDGTEINLNAGGLSIAANTNGSYNIGFGKSVGPLNLGINFSGTKSSSGSFSINASYMSMSLGQKSAPTESSGEGYVSRTTHSAENFVVPSPYGIFSFGYSYTKIEYVLNGKERNHVFGPIYYHDNRRRPGGDMWRVSSKSSATNQCESKLFLRLSDAEDYKTEMENQGCDELEIVEFKSKNLVLDVSQLPADIGSSIDKYGYKTDINHITLPNYDIYSVSAQGISGVMAPIQFENGYLNGLERKTESAYTISYYHGDRSAGFSKRPHFYFNNEISTYSGYADVDKMDFIIDSNHPDPRKYAVNPITSPKPRRKTSNFVEYFTNKEIRTEGVVRNFIKPNKYDRSTNTNPADGIGAFRITTADGRTYHYSLPVYNHEIITRTFDIRRGRRYEHESYNERRLLEPYATHWLLTAITGPDYIDYNNNGMVDEQDYGYWVGFEYGQWSDAFVWKNPYGSGYIEGKKNRDGSFSKTWIRGRKQVYYLDKVKTRTHSALFVKKLRDDARSPEFVYRALKLVSSVKEPNPYLERFRIPSHRQLALDKIILVKNEHDITDYSNSNDLSKETTINYNESSKINIKAKYENNSNVLDVDDSNIDVAINNAIKVIDFNYSYDLAKNTPHSTANGRLTLESVAFRGHKGIKVMPNYSFDYYGRNLEFNNNKDGYGYYLFDNKAWSLNKITTPDGADIGIDYETHQFKLPPGTPTLGFTVINNPILGDKYEEDWVIELEDLYDLKIGYSIKAEMNSTEAIGPPIYGKKRIRSFDGYAEIIKVDGRKVTLKPTSTVHSEVITDPNYQSKNTFYLKASYQSDSDATYTKGGIAVSKISVNNGTQSIETNYQYGEGYVSYLPFHPSIIKEYRSELPSPRVLYEEVTVENADSKTVYKFNTMRLGIDKYLRISKRVTEGTNKISDEIIIDDYKVEDYLSALGQLTSMEVYNKDNHLLSKTEYLHHTVGIYPTRASPNSIGLTKEAYHTYKVAEYDERQQKPRKLLLTSVERYKYPSIIKSTRKIAGGQVITTNYGSKFDEITGQPLEVYTESSNGTKMKTILTPAYNIPNYGSGQYSMGSKVDDITNKNMLTQQAAVRSFIEKDGQWKINNASITTWNNNWLYKDYNGSSNTPTNQNHKVWRKHKSFVWKGDINEHGHYINYNGDFDNFSWNPIVQSQPKQWLNVSTKSLYNHYSKLLEITDVNNNKSSVILDLQDASTIAKSNAKYDDILCSNMEKPKHLNSVHYLDKQVTLQGRTSITSHRSHTGKNCAYIDVNGSLQAVLKANKYSTGKYKVSFWVNKENFSTTTINGVNCNGEIEYAGDWVLFNHYVDISSNTTDFIVNIKPSSGQIFIDDFRMHPVNASLVSYVYNEYDELSSILNANNIGTRYKYNSAGSLIETQAEVIDTPTLTGGFKTTAKTSKKYKRPIN